VITGSVAIITEAVHSSIDLVASIVAFFSVRKAHEPADESHPYGHEKVENLASAFEGVLIVLGAAIIIFEAIRKLTGEPHVEKLGFGIVVIGFSAVANLFVSRFLYRRARDTDSPALEGDAAHLYTDALTSLGVLVALALVAITGVQELDAIAALVVAVAIVFSGVRLVMRSSRVLVDEALPEDEMQGVADAIREVGAPEVIGFHKIRARRGGSNRYVDLHVQFRRGTTLERAHEVSHRLQAAIRNRLGGADVLIHLEPEDAVQSPTSDPTESLSAS
jgi:cation diffusion facilitator family transporter